MQQPNPINIALIDHVVIRVNNLEAMIAFYCDVLGMRLERGPGTSRLAQLRAGRSLVDLIEVTSPLDRKQLAKPDPSAPNMDHLCLQITPWDSEMIQDHLTKHRVSFGEVGMRYGAAGSGPSLYLDDPEGNTVELKGSLP